MALRILFIGEIVGKAGIFCIKTMLPVLRKELEVDFVIANGDGATGGFGIGKNHAIYLRKLGVDVITSGDQIYYKKDMVVHIERASYLLRPVNFPPDNPGRGWRYYTVRSARSAVERGPVEEGTADTPPEPPPSESVTDGQEPAEGAAEPTESDAQARRPRRPHLPGTQTIAVVNFLGQSGFNRTHLSNPFTYLPELVARIKRETNIIIVDFHALTTAEKSSMFYHADGRVSAVVGTGTRVITSDATVLPGGTAVVSDAGRTGSLDSVAGLDPKVEIQKFLNQIPERSKDAWDNLELQGVLLEIEEDGRASGIEIIRRPCAEAPNHDRDGKDNER